MRNLRDLSPTSAAEAESEFEDDDEDDALPYGGDMRAAMQANDRGAIKKIMAHRSAASPVAEAPPPNAPRPPLPAPEALPGFVRQLTVRGRHLTFTQVRAEPPAPLAAAAGGPAAPGELGDGEVAASPPPAP